MKQLILFKALAVFILVLAFVIPTMAQEVEDRELKGIIEEINEKYCKKVEQALKKDMNRFNKMKSELEEIEKIKDNPGKKKGLDNYKKNHKEHYDKAVKESGVDLQQLLRSLHAKYPAYVFSIAEDYGIVIEKKQPEVAYAGIEAAYTDDAAVYTNGAGPNDGSVYTLPAYSGFEQSSTQDLLFTQNKKVNCALASGGNVEFGSRQVRAWTTSAVAGSCSSDGILNNETMLPAAAQSIKLNISATLECQGYALGILSYAMTNANTTVSAMVVEPTTDAYIPNSSFIGMNLYRTAVAPILWHASFNESVYKPFTIDLTNWKGKKLKTKITSSSFTFSLWCCATNSSGKATLHSANLQIVR